MPGALDNRLKLRQLRRTIEPVVQDDLSEICQIIEFPGKLFPGCLVIDNICANAIRCAQDDFLFIFLLVIKNCICAEFL